MTIDAMVSDYRFALVILGEDGAAVGQAALDVDWEPAAEWTRLQAIRGGLSIVAGFRSGCIVEPIWHRRRGAPYVHGFRARLADAGTATVVEEFGIGYFSELAAVASTEAADESRLAHGGPYRYAVTALPRPRPAAPADAGDASRADGSASTAGSGLRATSLAPAVRLRRGSLSSLLDGSRQEGASQPGDLPVFVPARVLAEAAEITVAAGPVETGGILIGHLWQDASIPEAFVQVTAQLPARHVEADATRLAFRSDTWTEVRSAIALRDRNEVMLGWWHSHPVYEWCKSCPPERQRRCPLAHDFFSAHDRALHRTVFPRAWSSALVMSRPAAGPPIASLFGWRRGSLEARGFHLLHDTCETGRRPRAARGGGDVP